MHVYGVVMCLPIRTSLVRGWSLTALYRAFNILGVQHQSHATDRFNAEAMSLHVLAGPPGSVQVSLTITIEALNSDGSSSCPAFALANMADEYINNNLTDVDLAQYQHHQCETPFIVRCR